MTAIPLNITGYDFPGNREGHQGEKDEQRTVI